PVEPGPPVLNEGQQGPLPGPVGRSPAGLRAATGLVRWGAPKGPPKPPALVAPPRSRDAPRICPVIMRALKASPHPLRPYNSLPMAVAWRGFAVLGVCFFLSGATALVYEVVWLRVLGLVFGHTVYAVTTVLSAFMAGLGLGSLLFGRRAA